jgi:hypothetical protein
MNYWILNNVELFDFADKIVKYNIENNVIDRPSLIFQKIYEKILNHGDNEYAIAMKDLNDQMYDFICGKREEIVDYKEFNLPHTNVSVDFNYIHKACIFAFQKDYVEFMLDVIDDLGLIIPENSVELFENNLERFRQTPSPKFDKFYQIRTFYENFIHERCNQTV